MQNIIEFPARSRSAGEAARHQKAHRNLLPWLGRLPLLIQTLFVPAVMAADAAGTSFSPASSGARPWMPWLTLAGAGFLLTGIAAAFCCWRSRQARALQKQLAAERVQAGQQEYLRLAMESAPLAAWEWRPESGLTTWPDKGGRLTLSAKAEMPFEEFIASVAEADRERVRRTLESAVTLAGEYRIDFQLKCPDGRVRALCGVGRSSLESPHGKVRVAGVFLDVTDQKKIEQELQESLERLKIFSWVVEQSPASVILTDRNGAIEYVNPKFTEVSGYSAAEVRGKNLRVLQSEDTPQEVYEEMWSEILAGREWVGEFRNRRKNGEIYVESAHVSPVRSEGGDIDHFVAVKEDVTTKRAAEERLRESEEKFRLIAESVRDVFWIASLESKQVLYVSPAFEEIWGIPIEKAYARADQWIDSVHSEDRPRVAAAVAQSSETHGLNEEFRIVRPDGSLRWVHSRGFAARGERDGAMHLVGVAEDISDRKRVELELARREEQFRLMIENASDVITIIDRKGSIKFQSPSIERVLGYRPDEMLGQNGFDFIHPDDREHAAALIQAAECGKLDVPPEYRIRHKSGNWRIVESHGQPLPGSGNLVLNSRDVTETRTLWEQYRQARKMEAIGNLAGGVAHDFNNLLTVILMHVDLLRTAGHLAAEQAESAAQIMHAAERAANLTRQLLLFSRKQAPQRRVLDLGESVGGVVRMLLRILGEDIQVQVQCPSTPVRVEADPGMIDQLLMNLAVNARDAMPAGGRLTIEVTEAQVDEAHARRRPEARPGRFARLKVQDTGSGIPSHVLPHIFEPFFTTKPVGKGTGMGLATVFGIVQQHHGWIEVETEPGLGATFSIYLPATEGADVSASQPEITGEWQGTETILLVEDEPAVRQGAVLALTRLGYTVLHASSGVEALERWKGIEERVDLLVTDLVMPGGVNGKELAENLQRSRPDLKVIYMSGYSADIAGPEFPLDEGVNFLRKPFEVQQLVQIVRTSLNEGRKAGGGAPESGGSA